MNKIDFSKTLTYMTENFGFKVRTFPSFSFGTKEECKKILFDVMTEVDKTISKLEWLPEYEEITDWMSDNKEKGLFLTGTSGRGKTTILPHVIPIIFYHYHRKVVKCTHATDLKNHLKEFDNKLLISVDDIGTEAVVNDFGSMYEAVNILFDMAESKSKILFISTNLDSIAIENRYGIRAADRISRLCRVVRFRGTV